MSFPWKQFWMSVTFNFPITAEYIPGLENSVADAISPGDFRSWESLQTLPALSIGPFELVERFQNLKLAVKRITNIESSVRSSSQGTAAIHCAFK